MKERNALHKELLSLGLRNNESSFNDENAITLPQPARSHQVLPCDPPVASDDLFDSPEWCNFRKRAVNLSLAEFKRWTDNGKRLKENQSVVLPFLKDYWTTVATFANNNDKATIINNYPLNSANETNPGANWGSAFLSFIIDNSRRGTSILTDSRFVYPFSGLNMANIVQALKNKIFTQKFGITKTVTPKEIRVHTNLTNFRFPHFYGYASVNRSEISIQPGDILCFNMENGTTHSVASIKQHYIDNANTPQGHCNCEMVIATTFDANKCMLIAKTIGGNLDDSVVTRRRNFKVKKLLNTQSGKVIYNIIPQNSLFFGIIKFPVCTSYTPKIIPLINPDPIPLKDPFKPGNGRFPIV